MRLIYSIFPLPLQSLPFAKPCVWLKTAQNQRPTNYCVRFIACNLQIDRLAINLNKSWHKTWISINHRCTSLQIFSFNHFCLQSFHCSGRLEILDWHTFTNFVLSLCIWGLKAYAQIDCVNICWPCVCKIIAIKILQQTEIGLFLPAQ